MQLSLEHFREQVNALIHADLPSADARYEAFANADPFPEIRSALLNAGHLASYAIMAGMIEPFELSALEKPATYLVPIEGPVRYRDRSGKLQRFYLTSNAVNVETGVEVRDHLVLEKNSICYVSLQPIFRIPTYLAARFNLLIRDVYRGLLVGTGPLVDPGFVGRLSIPLHNFTSNEYVLKAGEGFVYFEFTKLSVSRAVEDAVLPAWWRPPINAQPPFPGTKNLRRSVDDYLSSATGGLPAENAVGEEIRLLGETSKTIENRARLFTFLGYVAVAALLVGVVGVVYAGWQVYLAAQQVVQTAKADVDNSHEVLASQMKSLQEAVTGLQNDANATDSRQIDTLRDRLDDLERDMRSLEAGSKALRVPGKANGR